MSISRSALISFLLLFFGVGCRFSQGEFRIPIIIGALLLIAVCIQQASVRLNLLNELKSTNEKITKLKSDMGWKLSEITTVKAEMKEDQQLSVEKLDAAIKNAHGWKNISDMSTKDNELIKSENKKLKKEILLLKKKGG